VTDDNPYPPGVCTLAIRGYRERLTPKSRFKVVEIDFTADPAKDSRAWFNDQKRMLGENKVRREVLRDWTVAAGDAFYPEYANNGGMAVYGFRPKGIAVGRPVDRGYDFGFRRPVCVWGQEVNDRAYAFRVLAVEQLSGYAFFDLVLFLSGQIDERQMEPAAIEAYSTLIDEGHLSPGPWFPPGVKFEDFGGPEIFNRSAIARSDDPRSNDEIAMSKGIYISAPRVEIVDRESVMRRLLGLDEHGRPSILIDADRCPEIHAMFNGGLAYPPPTRENPKPSKPRKDGRGNDDIHDALSYWCVQRFPLIGKPVERPKRIVYRNRVPYEVEDEVETLNFYEGRANRIELRKLRP
jgi:hypothetical protein